MDTIQEHFSGTRRRQLTGAELIGAGFPQAELDRLVGEGELRHGVTGYWLPRPPDPGAASVMRRAMRVTEEQEQQDA